MNALSGKCQDCGHVFVVAHLPMPLVKVAQLAKSAACPKCASRDLRVANAAAPVSVPA